MIGKNDTEPVIQALKKGGKVTQEIEGLVDKCLADTEESLIRELELFRVSRPARRKVAIETLEQEQNKEVKDAKS